LDVLVVLTHHRIVLVASMAIIYFNPFVIQSVQLKPILVMETVYNVIQIVTNVSKRPKIVFHALIVCIYLTKYA